MPNKLHMRAAIRSQLQVARDRRRNAVPDKHDAEDSNILAPSTAQIEDLRAYLQSLSNKELREFGTAARHKCALTDPRDASSVMFAVELEESIAEFRRRHPKKPQARADRRKIVRAGLEKLHTELTGNAVQETSNEDI